jgi:phospholipid/cholesterol/gamma-HCH transport system substrate-binding protein
MFERFRRLPRRSLIILVIVASAGISAWEAYRFLYMTDHYKIMFSGSVGGLETGAPVQFNGVTVGKVSEVDLTWESPPRVKVKIHVAQSTPIRRDSIASLGDANGARSIEISGGTEAGGRLALGEPIRADEGTLSDIERQTADINKQTHEVIASLGGGVRRHGARALVGMATDDFTASARSLRAITDDLSDPNRLEKFNQAIDNLNHATATLDHAIDRVAATADTISGRREEIVGEVAGALKRLNKALDSADRLMVSGEKLVSTADIVLGKNADDLRRTLDQVNTTTGHLDDAAAAIKANPSSLIWGTKMSDREYRR